MSPFRIQYGLLGYIKMLSILLNRSRQSTVSMCISKNLKNFSCWSIGKRALSQEVLNRTYPFNIQDGGAENPVVTTLLLLTTYNSPNIPFFLHINISCTLATTSLTYPYPNT
ncbi:uncharacterized protein VICG_02114 [Vittaforma corneae ATCC 50505]|uniref:Uncharacterized protein n=1 Tax=Vittaforma corneae (strain ATCC 50505) TaxID=993615 RepID=L2GIY4_VITCO|nr:uncharacterized protein VICG_02114 [Vittaforma corneae ATCC 50505]ELA40848.1 hypothetical protein VICG_02114 [Vittaforma corneae ATCC 50505]